MVNEDDDARLTNVKKVLQQNLKNANMTVSFDTNFKKDQTDSYYDSYFKELKDKARSKFLQDFVFIKM